MGVKGPGHETMTSKAITYQKGPNSFKAIQARRILVLTSLKTVWLDDKINAIKFC